MPFRDLPEHEVRGAAPHGSKSPRAFNRGFSWSFISQELELQDDDDGDEHDILQSNVRHPLLYHFDRMFTGCDL